MAVVKLGQTPDCCPRSLAEPPVLVASGLCPHSSVFGGGALVCFTSRRLGGACGGLVCFPVLSVGRSALQEVWRSNPEHVVMVVLSLQFLPLPVI